MGIHKHYCNIHRLHTHAHVCNFIMHNIAVNAHKISADKFSIFQALLCSNWLKAVMICCTSLQWDNCSSIWVQKLLETENQNNKIFEDHLPLAYTSRHFLRYVFNFSILCFFTCSFLYYDFVIRQGTAWYLMWPGHLCQGFNKKEQTLHILDNAAFFNFQCIISVQACLRLNSSTSYHLKKKKMSNFKLLKLYGYVRYCWHGIRVEL